jgi:hypothetical protein
METLRDVLWAQGHVVTAAEKHKCISQSAEGVWSKLFVLEVFKINLNVVMLNR